MREQGEQRLLEAIESVEARSRAELVVVVRDETRNYLGNDLIVALCAALSVLAFQLYSAFSFALYWLLILPALTIPTVVSLLRAAPGLRGLFISEASKQAAAEAAAAQLFFTKGVRHTRERTGVLVFVALLEQRIVILPDAGITDFVPEDEWSAAAARFAHLLDEGGHAEDLADALEALGELLERHCESRPDDIDELPNAIDRRATG